MPADGQASLVTTVDAATAASGMSAIASAAVRACLSGPCSNCCDFSLSSDVFTCSAACCLRDLMTRLPYWLTLCDSSLYASAVRFLLANNHCISDPVAGVTQSLRTIAEWLAGAGHECRILTTARFESRVTFTIRDHLAQLGVEVPAEPKRRAAPRPVVNYTVGAAPVTLLLTAQNDETRPDRREAAQYLSLFEHLARRLRARPADRRQRPSDDSRGAGTGTPPRRDHGVCRARLRLLRPDLLRRRRSRVHVQPLPERCLSRPHRPRQHADRAADRLVDSGRARSSRARS